MLSVCCLLFTSTLKDLRTKHAKKTLFNAVLILKMVSITGALRKEAYAS